MCGYWGRFYNIWKRILEVWRFCFVFCYYNLIILYFGVWVFCLCVRNVIVCFVEYEWGEVEGFIVKGSWFLLCLVSGNLGKVFVFWRSRVKVGGCLVGSCWGFLFWGRVVEGVLRVYLSGVCLEILVSISRWLLSFFMFFFWELFRVEGREIVILIWLLFFFFWGEFIVELSDEYC